MPVRVQTRIARRLRRDATDVERILWRALRESFPERMRQHPIGDRIADVACPAAKLGVEPDGSQHIAQVNADEQRSADLAQAGYRVIRFWNNDVIENLEGVLASIQQALEAPPPHPALSAPEGGEGT